MPLIWVLPVDQQRRRDRLRNQCRVKESWAPGLKIDHRLLKFFGRPASERFLLFLLSPSWLRFRVALWLLPFKVLRWIFPNVARAYGLGPDDDHFPSESAARVFGPPSMSLCDLSYASDGRSTSPWAQRDSGEGTADSGRPRGTILGTDGRHGASFRG